MLPPLLRVEPSSLPLEEFYGVGEADPSSDLGCQVLNEGDMVTVQPVPGIKDIECEVVHGVLPGQRIGSTQVDDRVAGRGGFAAEDVAPVVGND